MKYPQAYTVPQQSQVGKMPALTSKNVAVKFQQNWMVKYAIDAHNNGTTYLDDSLTSLNWLQNQSNTKNTSPTPASSPVAFGFYANNEIKNMYYRLADPSWQNSSGRNLSLNQCFQKGPRQADESGNGGFWRINPDYNDMIDNGVSKKRSNSQEGSAPPPLKKIKKEQEGGYFPRCNNKSSGNESVVHFSNEEHKSLKDDFNWTSILHQDIEIGGIQIKTEDILDGLDSLSSMPSDTMSPQSDTLSPQSTECSSDNISIEDLCAQTDLSQDIPFDFTSNDPLVLTLNGSYLSPPADWLNEGLNAEEQVDVKHNSGLPTPIVSSPVQEHDNLDGRSWEDSITFADIAEAFNVDNLFDLENF